MIANKYRFHGHNGLRHVYQKGRQVHGPLCALKYLEAKPDQDYRVAVVISKKISKSAVVRNRIRRRIYEAVRLAEPKMAGPFHMVFTVFHDSLATLPAKELSTMVNAQLRQARIIAASGPPHGMISHTNPVER